MPTIKPRINITLDQETYDLIKGYSSLTKTSMSSLVAEMLTSAAPSLRSLLSVLTMAQNMQKDAIQSFLAPVQEIGEFAIQSQELVETSLQSLEQPSRVTVPGGTVGGVSGAAKGVNPLAINKGVRSTVRRETDKKTNKPKVWLAATSEA